MKKLFLSSLFVLCILTLGLLPARAAEPSPFSIGVEESAGPGGLLYVRLSADNAGISPAAFRLQLQFDHTRLKYEGASFSYGLSQNEFFIGDSAPLECVYACDVDNGVAPILSGNVATYAFRVKDAAEPGASLDFKMTVDQVYDFSAKPMALSCSQDLSIPVAEQAASSQKPASSKTPGSDPGEPVAGPFLSALAVTQPQGVQLTPPFSPERLEYEVLVEASAREIRLAAQAADPDSLVTVSRYTLGATGSATTVRITVRSADKKRSTEYRVLVHRAEASASSASSAVSEKSASSQKTAVSKAAGTANTKAPEDSPDSGSEAEETYIPQGISPVIQTNSIQTADNRLPTFAAGAGMACMIALLSVGCVLLLRRKPK